MTEARLAYGGGDGATFGLLEDQSVETLIPDWIKPGSPVTAFTLSFIVTNYGTAAARAVNDASGPCPDCGLHTFGAVKCRACAPQPDAEEGSIRELDADSAGYGAGVALIGALAGDSGLTYEEE